MEESVHLVPEGTPGATMFAVKRVNEFDCYSLGTNDLTKKAKLKNPMAIALIWDLKLQGSEDYFKNMKVGKSVFKRYSMKALDKIKSI